MITNHAHSGVNRPSLHTTLLTTAAALLLASAGGLQAQTYTWTGLSTTTSNWSDAANWTVSPATSNATPLPGLAAGLWLVFPQVGAKTFASNDIAGITGIDGIAFLSTSGYYVGQPVSMDATPSLNYVSMTNNNGGGTSNNWAINTTFNASLWIVGGNGGNNLAFSGVLSGTGQLYDNGSGAGQQTLWLLNPNNTFTGSVSGGTWGHYILGGSDLEMGPIELFTGTVNFVSMSTSNNPSSLGMSIAAYSAYTGQIALPGQGWNGSGSPLVVNFVGTQNCTSDQPWGLAYWQTGSGRSLKINNNSPNNSSLTWSGPWTTGWGAGTGSTQNYTLYLGGTSTGTNTIVQSIACIYQSTFTGQAEPMSMNGPGTWVFSGQSNGCTGAATVTANAHVIIQSNDQWFASSLNFASGCSLDVSWNDISVGANGNNVGPWTVGSNCVQTLTAGHTTGFAGVSTNDIYGSLALVGSNVNNTGPVTNGGTLDVAGTGTVGTLLITTNLSDGPKSVLGSNVTFTPGSGAINLDFGTNYADIGKGSNDLIYVNGNVDLSQGIATLNCTTKFPGVSNGVGEPNGIVIGQPYTIMQWTGKLSPHAAGSPGLAAPGHLPAATFNVYPTNGSGGLGSVTVTFENLVFQYLEWTDYSGGGNWTTSENDWQTLNTPHTQTLWSSGDSALFDDSALGFTINVPVQQTINNLVVSNNINAYVFNGAGYLNVFGTFIKEGSSSLTVGMGGVNVFATPIVLSAGTLVGGGAGASTQFPGGVVVGDANTGANAVTLYTAAATIPSVTVTANCANSVVTLGASPSSTANSPQMSAMSIGANNVFINSGNNGFNMGSITGSGNVMLLGGSTIEASSAQTMTGTLSVGDPADPATTLKMDMSPVNPITLILSNNSLLRILPNQTYQFGSLIAPPATYGALPVIGYHPGYITALTATLAFGPTNAAQTAVFNGSVTSNNAPAGSCINLTKTGPGTEVFTGDSSLMSGTNIIQQGTMTLNNATGSGMVVGPLTVNAGATLNGSGGAIIISNSAVISGTLEAGVSGETTGSLFTVIATGSESLEIKPGAAIQANIVKGVGTGGDAFGGIGCDHLVLNLPVVFDAGSILIVSNLSGHTNFSIGDQWAIANWQSAPANKFTFTVLPPLPPPLAWSLANFYNAGPGVISVVGSEATPAITWSNPSPISYGTALSSNQLNATAGVPGAFAYNPPMGAILPIGASQTLSVTFTPTDTSDYSISTATVSIDVSKATPVITWTNPAPITYGTALSSNQLNATASVPGAFAYNPPAATILAVSNNQTLSVTFTPTDTTNYSNATGTVSINVSQATPIITWANPAPITYGTALSSNQLNATASVPGAFAYNPPAATILAVSNNQTLSVTFTPTDTADYSNATASVTINVLPTNTLGSFSQIDMQCGGYLTGIVQHGSGRLIARTDGGGIYSSDNQGTWWRFLGSNMTSPGSLCVQGIAVPQTPGSSSNLILQAVGYLARPVDPCRGIWKSTDGGANWTYTLSGVQFAGSGPEREGGECIIFNPSNDSEAWAGSYTGNGFWVSANAGSSWTQVTAAPVTTYSSLHISPWHTNQLFAGGDNGLWVTTNHGANWTQLNTYSLVYRVTSGPDGTVYYAGQNGSLQLIQKITSTNWSNTASYVVTDLHSAYTSVTGGDIGNPIITATVLQNGDLVASDNYAYTLISANQGTNFSPVGGNLSFSYVPGSLIPQWATYPLFRWHPTSLVQDVINTNMWYGGAGYGPTRTPNNGTNWEYIPNGIGEVVTCKIAFHPTDPNRLYLPIGDLGGAIVTDGGLSGNTVTNAHLAFPGNGDPWSHRAFACFTNGYNRAIFPGGTVGGAPCIYANTNDTNWYSPACVGLPLTNTSACIVDAIDSFDNPDDFIVACGGNSGVNSGGIYRTTNAGASFTQCNWYPSTSVSLGNGSWPNVYLERDGANPNVRYLFARAATPNPVGSTNSGGGFFVSSNRGVNWTQTAGRPLITSPTNDTADYTGTMAADQGLGGNVWAAIFTGGPGRAGLAHSINGGASFFAVPGFTNAFAVDALNGCVAVYGSMTNDAFNKIYYSTNNGTNWTEITRTNYEFGHTLALSLDPHRVGRIFIATSERSCGIYTPGSGYVPAITWPKPASILHGTALTSTQLNATAGVPGAFVYNPPAGAILAGGSNQTLSVTFTPTNTADYYTTATATVTIDVYSPLAAPASITGVSMTAPNGALIISGTNMAGGATGLHYVVLTTTDLTTPLMNWTSIATNPFNPDGSFTYQTGAIGSTTNASYFCTKVVP